MKKTIKTGSCHCGAVKFRVTLENGIGELRRCNCSLCAKKGAVMASVPLSHLEVTDGADNLALYQWNMNIAKHYFCQACGIYTHHKRRSAPNEFAFNVACLDDQSDIDYSNIVMLDGASNSVVSSK